MQNSVKRLICKKKTLIPLQHRVSVPEKVQSLSLCNVGRENLKPCLKSQAVQMARNVFHPSLFHPWNSFHLNRRKRDNPRRELFLYLIHENKSLGIIYLLVKCGQICSAALFCCKNIWWSHCIAEYQRIFPQNFHKSSSSSCTLTCAHRHAHAQSKCTACSRQTAATHARMDICGAALQ